MFDGWFDRCTERGSCHQDETGNGKTLVGLMLLKSALNAHAGPAAYLTPDTVYLVDQVEAAAGDLGLTTARDPAVASRSAILLATVKTLFNGRPVAHFHDLRHVGGPMTAHGAPPAAKPAPAA